MNMCDLKFYAAVLILTFILIMPVPSFSSGGPSPSDEYGHQDMPARQLTKEHDLTLKIAGAAEELAHRLQKGANANRQHLADIHDFFVNFVDACHHAKEEQYYFPVALIAAPEMKANVVTLELHHSLGRTLLSGVERSLDLWEDQPEFSRREAAEDLMAYTVMLRRHIDLESNGFMKRMESALSPEQRNVVRSGFHYVEAEQLGEGFHEEYHALAMKILEKNQVGE